MSSHLKAASRSSYSCSFNVPSPSSYLRRNKQGETADLVNSHLVVFRLNSGDEAGLRGSHKRKRIHDDINEGLAFDANQ